MTDDVLSRAFQQYVRATAPKKRAVSSAPGPLYHRQRLGRRRMTELNSFQSAGSIPVWALPNAPDMTNWQWQPPKPPSFWPKAPHIEVEVEVEVEVDTHSSPLLAEPEPQTQPVVAPEPPATLDLRETAAVGEQIMLQTLAETTPPIGLKLQALFNDTFPTALDFASRFRTFTKSLQKEISGGRLRGPQIFETYDLGRRALVRAHRVWPQVTRSSLLPLLSSVIEGIKSTERLNPGFLRSSPRQWAILMKHMARQDASVKSARLFALLMESMPPMCRFKTRGAVLNVLSAYFRIWQDASIHGNSPEGVGPEVAQLLHLAALWAGRADVNLDKARSKLARKSLKQARNCLAIAEKCHEKASRFISKAAHLLSDDKQLIGYLADALKTHHLRVHRSLFVIATRLQGDSQGKWTRVGYNWLQILARLPNITQSRFKSLLQRFQKRGRGALSHTELGELLLLHWESKGMLTEIRGTRKIWKRLTGEDDTTAMAALAFAINAKHSPEQCTAIFWSYWDFMQFRVGVTTITKQMLLLSRSQNLSSGFLKRMAWTSGDYRTALMLHDILVKQTGKDANAWGPAFWEKYVTQNMKRSRHSLINPVVLVEKLLSPARPAEADCQETDKEAEDPGEKSDSKHRQRMRIRESIKIIASAPSLTARQRFRHTAAFTKHLANVQGFLTARDLASLTDVTTEVLKRGEGGSTQRLRWYLGIIFEQLGEEACLRVGMMLKRRREWNGQQLAGRVKPEEPVVKQRTASDLHRQPYEGPHQGRTWPLWRYHLLKNRQRDELRRIGKKAKRRKAKVRITRRDSEAKVPPSLNGDAFGVLCERSHRPMSDRRATF
jgi:hypothetical protein